MIDNYMNQPIKERYVTCQNCKGTGLITVWTCKANEGGEPEEIESEVVCDNCQGDGEYMVRE